MTGWSPPEGADPSSPTPDPTTGAPPYPPPYQPAPAPGNATGYGPAYGGYGYGWPPPPPAAPRPGIIPLRPIGLGEILDGSFTAIRTAPIASLAFGAIVMLINQALFLLINYTLLRPTITTTTNFDGSTSRQTSDLAAHVGATYIATAVLTSVELLAMTGVMAAIIGERAVGRRVRLKDARARLRPVAWPLTQVVAVVTLIVAGSVAVALGPGIAVSAAGTDQGGALLLGLGFLLLIVPVAYAWTTLSLAPAVIVLERQGVRAALRRSRKLVHGAWWRVFWISLLASLIAGVLGAVLSLPFQIFGGSLSGLFSGRSDNNLSFTTLLMSALGGFVAGTLTRPFQGGVAALLYVDRRMRAEGLDMALQQAAAEQPGAQQPASTTAPST